MKKITTLFAMLLLCAVTAMGQTIYTYEVNGTNFTYYRDGTTVRTDDGAYCKKLVSKATDKPVVTVQHNNNNIRYRVNNFDPFTNNTVYSILVDGAYYVSKYILTLPNREGLNVTSASSTGWTVEKTEGAESTTFTFTSDKTNYSAAKFIPVTTTYENLLGTLVVEVEAGATPPTSLTSGWYQLRWIDISTDTNTDYTADEVLGKYVANYAQDVTVNYGLYPLYLTEEPTTLDEKATTFVYFDKKQDNGSYGPNGNLRSVTGRYLTNEGRSSLTANGGNYVVFNSSSSYPTNSVITSATTGNNRFSLIPRGKSATPYIGQTTTNKYPMVQFWSVNLSDLGLEAWTVEMTGITETLAADNAQATYTGSDGYGVKSVYNGGTLFLATGATPTESDFTAPAVGGLTPTITVDAANHVVSLLYPDANYLQGKVDEASALYDAATIGNGYGYPEGQVLTDLRSAIEYAQTCVDNDNNLAQGISTLQAAVDAFMATENVKVPQPGSFIRLRSTQGAQAYLKAADAETRMTVTTTADESTIFLFTAEKKLLAYKNGIATKNVREIGTVGGYADADVFTFEKAVNGNFGCVSLWATYSSNPNYLHSTGVDGSNADRNTKAAQFYDNNTWTVEDVTTLPITLRSTDGENFFATFSAPVNVQISGASLNAVTNNNKTAAYNTVDTYMLKAGVGVLLSGTTASATATIITNDVADADYGLVSYYAAEAGTGATDKLYLGKGASSGKAGFYKLGNGTTSNGFKAYLDNSGNGAKEGFDLVFGGEVTGVESIDNSAVFNLQGQRVNKAQKGVYIQNGKKVVVLK